MTDQPWLPGEVPVLDTLINLWEGHRLRDPLPYWEVDMAYAFMQAIRFYRRIDHGVSDWALDALWDVRDLYENGRLTRHTLKPALMDFDRFAQRVAERGEG